ncbi:MAG TPA: EAL domain-containing protein [Scandinavium sp.]|jgi:EAL domain-containing protein (putative c-di-GMP-specific phosphodiesterase class I)
MFNSTERIIKKVSNNQKPLPIEIWFQPLFQLSHFKCVGGEVLVRGKYLNESILPFQFIIQLEEHGEGIVNLGHFVVETSFKYINKFLSVTSDNRLYNINVSRVELERENYADTVIAMGSESLISPASIILEITGNDSDLAEHMISNLNTLQSHGFNIAWGDVCGLDDFVMKNEIFSGRYIKLDRSLLASARLQEASKIIHEAHKLNITIIAEGVQTMNQVSFLLKENVTLGQGYLFSRPIPKEMYSAKFGS